ncbi:MAG: PEP-CTERM sorting domain-containing protein [Akkermansiaceae bacterium]|nr:PEP-CTERM sorting domain-containing protein [Akkermansiaceae bacterium]
MKYSKALQFITFSATVGFASATNILVSASDTSEIEAFLAANYSNANVTAAGNFSDFNAAATQSALNGVDLVIIGRSLSSSQYGSGRADGYNGLNIPVLNFTSYTARNAGNRMGWHTGSATNNKSVAGNETTLTDAGSLLLGVPAGAYDFFDTNVGETFNGLGTGGASVGGGNILATIGGDILAAYWATGEAPGDPTAAGVDTFPAPRLLLNLDDDPRPAGEFTAQTAAGLALTIGVIADFGGLTPVPEPSSALLGLTGLGLLFLRRRK